MAVQYRILQTEGHQTSESYHRFAEDVRLGLAGSPKFLSSKYLYDAEGDRLFQQIMELSEYYLTRCEFDCLRTHKDEIVNAIGSDPFNLIELGVGDGRKTEVLLKHFLNRGLDFRYIPIDICETSLQGLVGGLARYSPHLEVEGLVAEYSDGLQWLSGLGGQHNVVLFLGSNIGNFTRGEAREFLRSLWDALNDGDHLLIGFDLKKDTQQLLSAYNDSKGITARFNLNLLRRINRELGGNFDLSQFRYYSTYNARSGAIESYLVSRRKQEVYIEALGQSFLFEAWEPMHTEYSHKFVESDIDGLARDTGFDVIKQLYDSECRFVDSLWEVSKRND